MKTTLAVLLGLCIGSNAVQAIAQNLPAVCVCASPSDAVLECSATKPSGCALTVDVQQTRDAPNACKAKQFGKTEKGEEVAYCLVCVRRDPSGTAQTAPVLTWTLRTGSERAAFNTNAGIKIDGMSNPLKPEFIDKSHSDNLQQYKWQATLKNSTVSHAITAQVFGANSTTCDSNTARIVNTDK